MTGRQSGSLDVMIVAEQLRRGASGGIGTYIRALTVALNRDHRGVEVRLWCSRGPAPIPGVLTRRSVFPGPVLTRLWDRGVVRFPAGIAVSHAASLAVPARGHKHQCVTAFVHDTLWRTHPDTFPDRGRRWHEEALARLHERADRVLVPSEATARSLVADGFDRDRVIVTGEGADHLPLCERFDGGYLLAVSTLEPRKNMASLIEAYRRVRDSLPQPWPLKVIGAQGWGEHGVNAVDDVELVGLVSDAELARWYAGARALLYVPLAEGWGLPPVEAMRAGTPVLASPMPSTGGSALEVDPLDIDAIAAGILRVAADEPTRRSLETAGFERAASLRWDEVAGRHVDVWRSLVEAGE